MDFAVWISLIVGLVVVVGLAWFVLIETSIRVEPGTVALLLKRGKATSRALSPGRHFVQPWRKVMVQTYPSTELAFVAGGRPSVDPRVEYVDDPLRLHLGDKAFAKVSYTVRCQLDTGKLKSVHNQFGPEGLWTALRDCTRSALLAETAAANLSIDDVFGTGFDKLEQRLTKALDKALGASGFELRMFSLREVDLGETGEVIQATVRADAELEREQALAKVREARISNDAAMSDLLDGSDPDALLRYRLIESWRDLLQRWDGDRPIPAALTGPLNATGPVHTDDVDHAAHVEVDDADLDTDVAP
ncbi:MAG: SPFH domain-containing protein [Ilumatobacteraceae bacterium]